MTSSIARTKRSQSSRELSGRMMGGGFISGHDSLGTSSSWGRNSSSFARWRSRRNENGNVKIHPNKNKFRTLFHVHRSRWWGKTPNHKTGPLRKWFKQFQHLENNSSKSRDTGTTFKHLNILQRWKWVLSSCKIRLEFRCSLGSALLQSTSRKERGLVSPTAASNLGSITSRCSGKWGSKTGPGRRRKSSLLVIEPIANRLHANVETIGPFIRGKIRRALNKTRTVPFIRECLI